MKLALAGALFASMILTTAGCHSLCGRTYRCQDGSPSGLSGRYDNCEDCAGVAGSCDRCRSYTPWDVVRRTMTCGSGCGELYVDEWLNDPPCDSCDDCGNWTGPQHRHRPMFWRLRQLLGGRFHDRSCGCDSCAGEVTEWIESEATPQAAPTEAADGEAKRSAESKWLRRVSR